MVGSTSETQQQRCNKNKTKTSLAKQLLAFRFIRPIRVLKSLPKKIKNTVKEMGNKLKWLVHLCAQIYDALMRCCWQILLVKPSSRNKQGLSHSLSYSSSPVLRRKKAEKNMRTFGLRTLGEDEAAAKRV